MLVRIQVPKLTTRTLNRFLITSKRKYHMLFKHLAILPIRAVDPHLFFADPAVFLNADPDPAALKMRIQIQHETNCYK